MSLSVESLNVGVAAGISLYEIKMKWVLKMLTQKIQSSLGRNLSSASQILRRVFDAKLKEASPLSANQAILMMILHCEGETEVEQLARAVSLIDSEREIAPLIATGMLLKNGTRVSLSDTAREALAKIWSIHELSEQIAFSGFSEEERHLFATLTEKIYTNCEQVVP